MAKRYDTGPLHQVLADLETDPDRGLTRQESLRRQEQYGPNSLPQRKEPPLFWRVLSQLRDPMILVLLAAAGLSLLAGEDWLDAAIILVIVLFNTALSVLQEDNARRALAAFRICPPPKPRSCGREPPPRRIRHPWSPGTSSCWRQETWSRRTAG